MAKRIYSNAKDKILETAQKIILEQGIGNLTTDTIVSESGLSKGGFFYHFKTKDDLILALIEKLREQMHAEVMEIAEKDPVAKGRILRAYIKHAARDQNETMLALSKSFLEVLIKNPTIGEELSKFHKAEFKKISAEGIDPQTIMLVSCALDGFWNYQTLGMTGYTKSGIKKFFNQLIEMTY